MPRSFSHLVFTVPALALGTMLCTAPLWIASANAQYADQTEVANRLSRLEGEIQTMQRQLARVGGLGAGGGMGGSISPTQAPDFEIRLSQLERMVQEMVGKYEEAVFGVSQLRDRLDKVSSDADFRFSQLELRAGAETSPQSRTTPSSQPVAGQPTPSRATAATPPATPTSKQAAATVATTATSGPGLGSVANNIQEEYDEAFGLLRKADYDQAEKALSKFVTQHRESLLSGNAQYWLGETFYVRGKYAEAAVAFAEGFQRYPKSPKAPDILLKLGMSLSSLKQRDDACKTLGQLSTLFPT
ncbi:MAG: tol-pal system protein YbgF, partial [Rhodospirillaceae bacterium]